MSQLTSVTGKRATPENPVASPQPYKVARTGTEDFHSNAPNQTNGHSYTRLPSFQGSFNGVFRAPLHTPTPEEFDILKERVIELESRVSLLEMMGDRSSNSEYQTLPPPEQEAKLTNLATISSIQTRIVTTPLQQQPGPTAFAAFSSQPPTIPPTTLPPPRIAIPPAQRVMPTASAPVSSAQARTDFGKGSELAAKKEYKEAIVHYLKALAAEPGNSHTHFNLGQCYRNTKEFPTAIEWFSKVLQPKNLYEHAQIAIAKCHYEQKEYNQGIEILSKIQPGESDKWYNEFHKAFGDCHRLLEDHSKAIEHYKKVAQTCIIFVHVQNCLGFCYSKKNEPQTAIGFYKEALKFAGSDEVTLGEAHCNLGLTYLKLKDDSKARMHFQLVPKGHEKFGEAQEHLKQCQTPKPAQ